MTHHRIRWRASITLVLALSAVLAAAAASGPTSAPTTRGTAPRPTKSVPRTGCVTAECHPDVKQYKTLHGPVNVNACDACHKEVDASRHTYELARTGKELCGICHQLALKEPHLHKPVVDGQCVQCHRPHGGSDRYLLKAETPNDLCKQCHEDVVGAKKVVHGPVAAGACSACHAAHASKFPKLLSGKDQELCLQCHVSKKDQIKTMRFVHGPVATDCRACHDAHASDHKMMLKAETGPLCNSCHEDIKHTVETAKTKHAAVTTERACLNCHDPHASNFPSDLKDDMLKLCFECHDREITLKDGTKLSNIKAVLATGKSLHGPIAQHNCAACHQIHGGSNFRLLVKAYPPEFYAPFKEESYALCFSCHERQLVRDARTTTLTNFRNGDISLHYLHVNQEKKGRTCRACHETHASSKAKHIRESVPFGTGGWKLPINYEKSETGGKCGPGCHRPYAYDRVNPVDNQPLEKPALWPDETSKKKGGKP